jgi:hypothetical protein
MIIIIKLMLVFWVVMLCGFVGRYCFGGSYCLHLQSEDGGSMILWNVGIYLQVHAMLQPSRPISSPPQISLLICLNMFIYNTEVLYVVFRLKRVIITHTEHPQLKMMEEDERKSEMSHVVGLG